MKRKHVYNLLTLAAIIVALGSDCLQSAGESVMPGAMAEVVQKVANRIGRGLCRQVRLTEERPTLAEAITARSLALPTPEVRPPRLPQIVGEHLLNLPPPLA